MPACLLLLETPTAPSAVTTYLPAPWYVKWAETMPGWLLLTGLVVAAVMWLLKKPIETAVGVWIEQFAERMKRTSKEPASAADLSRKARKAVILEQAAEALRVRIACDHVSVYGCQNGEYLRSGEGIDKFVMQAEATAATAAPRYMDTERVVFANDIPRTVLALEAMPYLLLWTGHCDDWKVNKMMQERGYASSVAVFIRRPTKGGGSELGVIGMFVLSWSHCTLYRPDHADSLPAATSAHARLLDGAMETLLADYASQFSYNM